MLLLHIWATAPGRDQPKAKSARACRAAFSGASVHTQRHRDDGAVMREWLAFSDVRSGLLPVMRGRANPPRRTADA